MINRARIKWLFKPWCLCHNIKQSHIWFTRLL